MGSGLALKLENMTSWAPICWPNRNGRMSVRPQIAKFVPTRRTIVGNAGKPRPEWKLGRRSSDKGNGLLSALVGIDRQM